MGATNRVIAGDNKGEILSICKCQLKIGDFDCVVKRYEELEEDSQKAKGSIGEKIIRSLFFGRQNMFASQGNKEIHIIAIEYGDNEKSLIEVDEKIYKVITENR